MRSKNKGLMEQIKTYAEEYAMSHGGAEQHETGVHF